MIDSDTFTTRLIQSHLTRIISETNGITLKDTLELLLASEIESEAPRVHEYLLDFRNKLRDFQQDRIRIYELLRHPVALALGEFFRGFPIRYREEHIHLTGSLSAEFIYPRIQALLAGPHRAEYEASIKQVYGEKALPIRSVEDVDRLLRLRESEGFDEYLKILHLPKLILVDERAHEESAYHLAKDVYTKYNVGFLRLKFTLSRSSTSESEKIPGGSVVSPEDVVMGLCRGLKRFATEQPDFDFVLSPSFRKEPDFFDASRFRSKREHFLDQVNDMVRLLQKYPELTKYMRDVDTVGNEQELHRKEHFNQMASGFRKLRYLGFNIRSHHGETFKTLRRGIQAVDNAMNIWHIDTLEHGLALGINPNFYFHRVYQRVHEQNKKGQPIGPKNPDYLELLDLDWNESKPILEKLLHGDPLAQQESIQFLKIKFHTAREIEHYQHDVLNRLLDKGVGLVALPSSNKKLTGRLSDYKDHPFSWWEKKGVQLGVGTDNYITLNTNFIQELLILLVTDADNLKITKLLMVASGESRRPFISQLLWKMRKQLI